MRLWIRKSENSKTEKAGHPAFFIIVVLITSDFDIISFAATHFTQLNYHNQPYLLSVELSAVRYESTSVVAVKTAFLPSIFAKRLQNNREEARRSSFPCPSSDE